jgi:tetratricopeptide (TPR) repeat protein
MKAHYGEKNLKLAITYNNIGNVYKEQGKLDQALEMYVKCLNIEKGHYGDKNFNLIDTYYNLSLLYEKLNYKQKSLEFAKKAYSISSSHYGKNHQKTNKIK